MLVLLMTITKIVGRRTRLLVARPSPVNYKPLQQNEVEKVLST